jgi:glycosyltransferase involved in cell wall biosynthesis/GT2 family glycosyltransferase
MKSGATESSFYYLNQYYKIPENVEISRSIEVAASSQKKIKILWAHDNCDQPQLLRLPELASHIDAIVCVSNWEKEQFIKYNRAPAEKIVVIPNGVANIFEPPLKKKSKTCIYFSAPHKGLAPLPKIWKQVVKNHPDATLKVFSSSDLYGNTYAKDFSIEEHKLTIEELKTLPGVVYSPCIDREELLSHIQDAAFFIHPNIWEETFCVSMAEAMACGCYPITSDIGALSEISFNRGKYIPMIGENDTKGWKPSPKFINEFAQEVSRCLEFFDKEPDTFYAATKDLSKVTKTTYDWKKIAVDWEKLIDSLSEERVKYFCMVNTKNSQEYTYKALETFAKHTRLNQGDKFFLIDNDDSFQHKINGINLIKNKTPQSFAKNVNQVLSEAIENKADFVMLNNDIIFTENWLEPLINHNSITLPLCNQYITEKTNKFEVLPAMDISEYIGNEKEFDDISKKITSRNLNFNQPKLISFYCFYLPYSISSVVGLFDEDFGKGGGEDVDYRLRAHLKGYETRLVSNSYVLHFMGKSTWRGGETQEETQKRNEEYYQHFVSKWGKETADDLLLHK